MSRPRSEIQSDIRKIIFPGEYGMGEGEVNRGNLESIPESDKKAWERVGKLVEELEAGLEEHDDAEYGIVRYQITIDVLEELVDNDNQTATKTEIEEVVFDELVRQYERTDKLQIQEIARWKTRVELHLETLPNGRMVKVVTK